MIRNAVTKIEVCMAICIIVILLSLIFVAVGNNLGAKKTFTAKVVAKAVIAKNDGDGGTHTTYRVNVIKQGDTEISVLDNYNAPFIGKYKSAEIDADIMVGKAYEFETVGVRYIYWDWYPNILNARLIE